MADREQIDKMARAMCGFCIVDKRCALKCCAPCIDVASCDCSYKENAKMLIDAGYGDVSEYKAEIERLNSNNGFLQCVISHSKDMMDEAVKKAQIDVLNKLKTKHDFAIKYMGYPWDILQQIDELIKEVENDK